MICNHFLTLLYRKWATSVKSVNSYFLSSCLCLITSRFILDLGPLASLVWCSCLTVFLTATHHRDAVNIRHQMFTNNERERERKKNFALTPSQAEYKLVGDDEGREATHAKFFPPQPEEIKRKVVFQIFVPRSKRTNEQARR